MTLTYCEKFGIDESAREERLSLFGLSHSLSPVAASLQEQVIGPHALAIIESFYDQLFRHAEAKRVMARGFSQEALSRAQLEYLLSLGVDFGHAEYFERRLQVGMAHIWAEVSVSLYMGAYRILQQTIIDYIPHDSSIHDDLLDFVLKITMFDMSLALEAYHQIQVSSLEKSLAATRDSTELLRTKLSRDALTLVQTRASVLDGLQSKYLRARQLGRPLCVVMADIDYFKRVNDSYGHLVGDKVLHDVASRIVGALRENEDVGRYGGEEFLIVLPDAVLEAGHIVAERVRAHVAATPVQASGSLVPVTISLGLAQATEGEKIDHLIARADAALYEAKRKGRNRVEIAL